MSAEEVKRRKGHAGHNCAYCRDYAHILHRAVCTRFRIKTSHATVCDRFVPNHLGKESHHEN